MIAHDCALSERIDIGIQILVASLTVFAVVNHCRSLHLRHFRFYKMRRFGELEAATSAGSRLAGARVRGLGVAPK